MAAIAHIECLMVDLIPKVTRTDAIQAFVSQETPIVRITDADGHVGIGYTYTIGTGGPAVMSLLGQTLLPRLIGREADEIEAVWRDLLFATHATAVGAITSLALAAIDTALWDLRCRRAGVPLWRMAGGAKNSVPLYTTEGGWLHLPTKDLVRDAVAMKAKGFAGAKVKIGNQPSPRIAPGSPRCGRWSVTASRSWLMQISPFLYLKQYAGPICWPSSASAGSRNRCPPTMSARM